MQAETQQKETLRGTKQCMENFYFRITSVERSKLEIADSWLFQSVFITEKTTPSLFHNFHQNCSALDHSVIRKNTIQITRAQRLHKIVANRTQTVLTNTQSNGIAERREICTKNKSLIKATEVGDS